MFEDMRGLLAGQRRNQYIVRDAVRDRGFRSVGQPGRVIREGQYTGPNPGVWYGWLPKSVKLEREAYMDMQAAGGDDLLYIGAMITETQYPVVLALYFRIL